MELHIRKYILSNENCIMRYIIRMNKLYKNIHNLISQRNRKMTNVSHPKRLQLNLLFLIILLLSQAGLIHGYDASVCIGGEVGSSGWCYFIMGVRVSWADAQKICQSQNGELAQPADLHALQQLFEKELEYGYWLGGSDADEEGTWRWAASGELIGNEDSWYPGEPNNANGNENCLFMVQDRNPPLDDRPCDDKYKFICEKTDFPVGSTDHYENKSSLIATRSSYTCRPGEFACDVNNCIRPSWLCDGDKDCIDGSDEDNCGVTESSEEAPVALASTYCHNSGQIQCKNGVDCINPHWLCDGEQDCKGGSDEENCETTLTTKLPSTTQVAENEIILTTSPSTTQTAENEIILTTTSPSTTQIAENGCPRLKDSTITSKDKTTIELFMLTNSLKDYRWRVEILYGSSWEDSLPLHIDQYFKDIGNGWKSIKIKPYYIVRRDKIHIRIDKVLTGKRWDTVGLVPTQEMKLRFTNMENVAIYRNCYPEMKLNIIIATTLSDFEATTINYKSTDEVFTNNNKNDGIESLLTTKTVSDTGSITDTYKSSIDSNSTTSVYTEEHLEITSEISTTEQNPLYNTNALHEFLTVYDTNYKDISIDMTTNDVITTNSDIVHHFENTMESLSTLLSYATTVVPLITNKSTSYNEKYEKIFITTTTDPHDPMKATAPQSQFNSDTATSNASPSASAMTNIITIIGIVLGLLLLCLLLACCVYACKSNKHTFNQQELEMQDCEMEGRFSTLPRE